MTHLHGVECAAVEGCVKIVGGLGGTKAHEDHVPVRHGVSNHTEMAHFFPHWADEAQKISDCHVRRYTQNAKHQSIVV